VGFLGPGPLRVHLEHARTYGSLIPSDAKRLIDLGSGGGLPGLPLLADAADMTGVLLDAASKRTAFLVWAAVELGISERVSVVTARAEVAAHELEHRGQYDVVACRGFGPPAHTIECSAGFLAEGARLLISEPPHRRQWSTEALESIGLAHTETSNGVAVFRRIRPVPDEIPRTIKRMQKRPLPVEA
jgi:16S rRNA (guanine527-N7)-methyltransferase